MDVTIIARSRQGDGTQHLEVTAPAGSSVEDVIVALIRKLGFHPDCEGWGEVIDDTPGAVWTYHISVEP